MNGKHTPGPWVADALGTVGSIDTLDGEAVAQAQPRQPLAAGKPDAERLANARLIAAAPKMLTELEAAAAIFRAYEAMHQAKGTDEGIGKAKRNRAFAESLERTIAEAKGDAA